MARNLFTSSSPAQQAVGNSAEQILGANPSRTELIIVNTGTVPVFLGLGRTPTGTAYHVALAPCGTANDGTGGSFICDWWTGPVQAIAPAGGGAVCATEISQ
jgi:hypothetical protein